jgi:hypothetical protein
MNDGLLIAIFTAVFASQGLWALILYLVQRKDKKKDKKEEVLDHQSKMLLGLGHDRIICLGKEYLAKGSMTEDEYENLNKYLYAPYKALGGNGTAEKIMEDVRKLPINTD